MASVHYSSVPTSNGNVLASDEKNNIKLIPWYFSNKSISSLATTFPIFAGADEIWTDSLLVSVHF